MSENVGLSWALAIQHLEMISDLHQITYVCTIMYVVEEKEEQQETHISSEYTELEGLSIL